MEGIDDAEKPGLYDWAFCSGKMMSTRLNCLNSGMVLFMRSISPKELSRIVLYTCLGMAEI
jgi:hypothetical protein